MIELMFGEAKNPRPAPKSSMNPTRCEYGVDSSVVENRKRDRRMTGVLEVEAQEEQDRAERDRIQELSDNSAGELPDPEELEVEQGMGVPPLEDHKKPETDNGHGKQHRHGPRLGDPIRREGEGEEEAHDEHGERGEPAPIDRRTSLELPDFPQPEAGPRGAEDTDRHVHVEQGAPIEEREEDAAERQACHGPHSERDLVDPERKPELLRRGRVHDHRRAVREQNRGAEALDRAEGDRLGRVERQARQERADREDRESARVQLDAADDVRDATDEEERDRAPEDVRLGDPDRLLRVRPEARGDLRKADDDDAGVDPGHEHAHGRDRQDRPLVLDPARLPRRTRGTPIESDPIWRATKQQEYVKVPTHSW